MSLLAGYLTESEAAAELGRTARTLAYWRKRRIGPAFTQIAGKGQVLYRREAILRWLEQQEVQPVRTRRQQSRTSVSA
jgi:DNA-binding transcriptional MerR regulator